jgi:hypothetical protein
VNRLNSKGISWSVPIARWAAWPNSGESSAPDVSFIEPMQRRRLSSLAKMTLRVAHDCTEGLQQVRFVFSSRHGDLARTTVMLNDLAEDEPLSPTTFSLSVLNASTGLFSILRSDTTASTALSAAESSFGYGLLESAAQFAADPTTPVLYVYADEPAPNFYNTGAATTGSGHALAILLSDVSTLNIECHMGHCELPQNAEPHSLIFLSSLKNNTAAEWYGEGKRWSWTIQ